MYNSIIACLLNEVKPATGCTEPVAIALATAYACRGIDNIHQISSIQLTVSTNILKNAMNVGVPKTSLVGLEIAASLGAFGNSDYGMNLFSSLSDSDVADAHRFHATTPITIERYKGPEVLSIGVKVTCCNQVHEAIVTQRHDRLSYYAVDGEVFYADATEAQQSKPSYAHLFDQSILSLLEAIDQGSIEPIKFLLDGYYMNKEMADRGLATSAGLGLGKALQLYTYKDKTFSERDLIPLAMQMTAAASDARMAGLDLPVMTSNGSGNNGITAVLPIVAANMIFNFPEERLIKSLAMSHMVNSYIKYEIGRLSPICACGVASATGAAIGIGYLLDIELSKLPSIIDTMVANLSGMACDGAKLGCSLKLSTASAAAIQSVYLLKQNSYADFRNGIVGKTPELSIKNLGKLAKEGMQNADAVMTDIMLSKSLCD